MSEPRNVDDVAYAALDGERPMREVLKERKRRGRDRPKDEREKAFRLRAGTIGMLQSCLCSFPIVQSDTTSKHEEWCPAHHLLLSYQRANPSRTIVTVDIER